MRKPKRQCYIKNDLCYIPLQNGQEAFTDIENINIINKHSWYFANTGYPTARINKKLVSLHKILLFENKIVDHINKNKLDNRLCNLRYVTKSQNMMNCYRRLTNTTGYKGVHYHKRTNSYYVHLTLNYKHINIGYFKNLKDAACAYDKAAIKYFGEYACLNFEENREKYNKIKNIF
jgi:hypothetical protein